MPSPDVTPYVDLTLLDVDAEGIATKALTDLAERLPGWTPREGNTEVLLIEALAVEVADLVNALNRVPGAVLEALLGLYGLTRSAGTAATVPVTITATDAIGHTLPAGSLFRLTPADGTTPVDFATSADVEILAGDTTATAVLIAEEATARVNNYSTGTRLDLVEPVPGIRWADTTDPVTGGIDPEDGPAFLARAVTRLGRLVDTLVLADHFTTRALEEVDVARAVTLDNTEGDTGDPATGNVTVAVAGPGGTDLGPSRRAIIEAALSAQALASLTVWVIAAEVTAVDVEVTAQALPDSLATDVEDAITAALTDLLDPDAWDWDGTVRLYDLVAAAGAATGVDYITTLELAAEGDPVAAADLPLTGIANLTDVGTITVTITGGL